MTEVRWTTQAADDLQAIYDFIARDSSQYAQLTVQGILVAVDRLEQFPLLGAARYQNVTAMNFASSSNHPIE